MGVEKRHDGSGKGRERRRKHDWKNGEEKTFYYCTLELCVGSFRRRRLVGSQIPDYFFVLCSPLSLSFPHSRVCVKAFFLCCYDFRLAGDGIDDDSDFNEEMEVRRKGERQVKTGT